MKSVLLSLLVSDPFRGFLTLQSSKDPFGHLQFKVNNNNDYTYIFPAAYLWL